MRRGDNIASKLIITFRLNIPSMILIKIAYFIHKVYRRTHVLWHINCHCTVLSKIAYILSQWRIILDKCLFNCVHYNVQSDGKSNENDSHHDIEYYCFFEGCLSKLGINEEEVYEFVCFLGWAGTCYYALSLLHMFYVFLDLYIKIYIYRAY
jgi:hypothetical protein